MDNFDIREWYLWHTWRQPGAFNMAADDYMAREMARTLDRPVLRFYTWNPHCVSLGYHQKPADLDLTACRRLGYEVVKRPTGGRAVLHAQELTYSVVYPFRELDAERFYHLTHIPFVQALRAAGIPAEFQAAQSDFRHFYRTEKAAVCFATSARYEVEIDGRKLIGSAQRIYQQAILQHGSLLLGPEHERLVDLLPQPEDKRRAMREYIRRHTAYVWQYRQGITATELSEAVARFFTEIFGIRFIPLKENRALQEAVTNLKAHSEFAVA